MFHWSSSKEQSYLLFIPDKNRINTMYHVYTVQVFITIFILMSQVVLFCLPALCFWYDEQGKDGSKQAHTSVDNHDTTSQVLKDSIGLSCKKAGDKPDTKQPDHPAAQKKQIVLSEYPYFLYSHLKTDFEKFKVGIFSN